VAKAGLSNPEGNALFGVQKATKDQHRSWIIVFFKINFIHIFSTVK